jgi:hypothetical protein
LERLQYEALGTAKMPVVFRERGLRYFFFSNEGSPREPPHVHVKGGGRDAKIWLEPDVSIADSYGFNARELATILRVVNENRDRILRAWHDHFGNGRPL